MNDQPDDEATGLELDGKTVKVGTTVRDRMTGAVGVVTGIRMLAGDRVDVLVERLLPSMERLPNAHLPGAYEIWYAAGRLEVVEQPDFGALPPGGEETLQMIPLGQLDRNAKGLGPMTATAAQQIQILVQTQDQEIERLRELLEATVCTCTLKAKCPKHSYSPLGQ